MACSITLSKLTWSTPDGRQLFSDLDLTFGAERTGLVGRNGVGKSTLLALIAGDLQPVSGGISVQGSLARTLQTQQAGADATIADFFGLRDEFDLLDRAEAGLATADELANADWMLEARVTTTLSQLGLSATPTTPFAALSGGQQTRATLAKLVLADPDFLLLDEPTNNLDQDGRKAVADLLNIWQKGAVVVSHDRDLLDQMDAIVELTSLGATRYGGNYSHYRALKAQELAAAHHDLADAERQLANSKRDAQARAERQARRDKAGRKKRKKGDMPKLLMNAMKERSEGTGGATARLSDDRIAKAEDTAIQARKKIERLQPLEMTLPSTGLPRGRTVLEVRNLVAGYAPGFPVIKDLSFSLTGPERVALTGPNGSGKTTLLSVLVGKLRPDSGYVHVSEYYCLLDQHVTLLDPASSLLENFKRLDPDSDENTARAALARFKFRADAALQPASSLSGGERLRAGLACTLATSSPPQLLILDEPTNHLDLDAIEALESALNDYDGAVLVVSHDTRFLEAIRIERRIDMSARTHPG